MFIQFLFNHYPRGHFVCFHLFIIASRMVIYWTGYLLQYNKLPQIPTALEQHKSVSVGQESRLAWLSSLLQNLSQICN